MTPDVSLVVGSPSPSTVAAIRRQTLRSLESVDDFGQARGTWVMFIADGFELERHAAKNLLLAAESGQAPVAIGGSGSAAGVTSIEQLASDRDHVEVSCMLLERAWLTSQTQLLNDLRTGVTRIPSTALGAANRILLIPQQIRNPLPAHAADQSRARIQAGPVGRLAAAAFSLARLLPLRDRILFDVAVPRAVDTAMEHLSAQWRELHPQVRQTTISPRARNTWRHAWQLGRARWLVTNEQFISRLPKRGGQRMLVATSELPLVRSGRDDPDWVLQPTSERRPSWSQIQRWDVVAVSGDFATQVMRSSTAYVGEMIPEASVFAEAMVAALEDETLRHRLGLQHELPVVLCALATPRYVSTMHRLADAFHGRLHFVLVTDDGLVVEDGSAHQVFEDLPSWCAASALLVTDWSSLTMEFGRLERPIIAFAPDHRDVVRRRGTYLALEALLPGPIVSTPEELSARIESLLVSGHASMAQFHGRYAQFAQLAGPLARGAAEASWTALVGHR